MRKTTNLNNLIRSTFVAALLSSLWLAGSAVAGPSPAPGGSHAFGKTLAEWQDTYFRWFIGQTAITPDANGNADVGHIVLLPLPNVPGDGTPGHLDITLNPGQGFYLPLFFFLGTSYTDGTPSDTFVDASFFQTLNLTLQIDGVTVVSDKNSADYYAQFFFAPPIPINFPPIDSAIWSQGVSVVHNPFSVGKHTIKLDIKSAKPLPPNFGTGFPEYHNSWTLTVQP